MAAVPFLTGDVSRVPGPIGAPFPSPAPVNAHGPQLLEPAPPTAQEVADAKADLRQQLDQWGLGSLVDWVYDQYIVQDKPLDFVLTVLLPEQQAYKDRFAANARRQAKGLRVLSPYEYLAREEASRQARREAGFAAGFYDDPKDFEDIIAEDMSVAEERARLVDGYRDVANADPEVRRGFAELYGVQGDAYLAMYFIDPVRALPILERQEQAARAFGAAARTGYGAVSREEAEGIAALGISEEGFVQGFGQLAESRPLFTAIDVGEEAIGREEQLGAAFKSDTAAQQIIERRRRRRQAQFEGGGGFVTGQGGFAGLGGAET